MTVYNPRLARAFIQVGGFGQKYKALPVETTVGATSGGGFASESDFTGSGAYVGSRRTGNDDRVTFDISVRREAFKVLRDLGLARNKCYFNFLVLEGCAPQDITQFDSGRLFLDTGVASFSASDVIVQGMETSDPKVLDTLGADAAIELPIDNLAHQQVGVGTTADPLNDIIAVGITNCAGECGADNDGGREFIAVGSPTGPATIPKIVYTDDKFNTTVVHTLIGVTDGDAVGVALHMNQVLVAVTGTSAGLYRVTFESIKLAAAIAVQLVGGISSGTAVNKVASIGNNIVAVGDNGAAWISEDGGFNFTALTTGSTEDFMAVGGSDENLIWIGGTNGALYRYRNGVVGAVASGVTDDILTVTAPPYRSGEVYFGTDAGEIWQSFNADDSTPTFEEYTFDLHGTGQIPAISFADARGAGMFFIQTNATPDSRVFRDLSSGNGGVYANAIGSFASPSNNKFNALAATSINSAAVVGEVISATAFIGIISG